MRRDSGQTATEYMLLLSVLVVAVVASAYVFVPEFQGGVAALAQDASVMLATGQIGGIGFARNGTGSGGSGGSIERPGSGGDSNDSTSHGSGGSQGFGSSAVAVGGASFDRSGEGAQLGVPSNPSGTAGTTGQTAGNQPPPPGGGP